MFAISVTKVQICNYICNNLIYYQVAQFQVTMFLSLKFVNYITRLASCTINIKNPNVIWEKPKRFKDLLNLALLSLGVPSKLGRWVQPCYKKPHMPL